MSQDNNIMISEHVSKGHPDKMADIISDSILDLFIEKDRNSKVACETMLTGKNIIIGGEINSSYITNEEEIKSIIKNTIKSIGYTKETGYDVDNLDIQILLSKQSEDILMGVEKEDQIGAGDQGFMYGYATNESYEYLPLSLSLSRHIINYVDQNKNKLSGKFKLYPDAKSQICIKKDTFEITDIVLSHQHSECNIEYIRKELKDLIIESLDYYKSKYNPKITFNNANFFINKTGKFIIGGPVADCGLTGRKIVVDTYGGIVPNGGGAFSGKDPTKVDRSAAYMCRYLAKKAVAAGFADKCLIDVGYCIGYEYPISYNLNTFNTRSSKFKTDKELLDELIKDKEILSPKYIINFLKLKDSNSIKYSNTAKNGHFGNFNYTWENV